MKKVLGLIIGILFLFNACKNKPLTEEQMRSEWQKMNATKEETIKQFNHDKFGMFIHWGLYAIPGGIWKGKTMEEMRPPRVAEWVQHAAEVPRAEYAQLASQFNPTDFNAETIVKLAKAAGMKYLVITSKHHDGFAMYDSPSSKFDIMDATPFKRDVVRELYDACKKYDIDFGLYYSHNIDWADGADGQYYATKEINDAEGKPTKPFGCNLWDPSPNTFDEYLNNKAFPQVKEIMTQYPGMKQVWYDMAQLMKPEQSYKFYKAVYDVQPEIIVNERVGNGFGDFDIPGDNKIPTNPDMITKPWQTVGTLNNSWGYKSYDNDWKSVKELIFWLTEIVSKGGNYMLNVGPDAMGNVPQQCTDNLLELGKWIDINGEAIYGTSRWIKSHEGPTDLKMDGTNAREKEKFKAEFTPQDFWFTAKENLVYAIAIEYPADKVAVVKTLNTSSNYKVKSVKLLGHEQALSFEQKENGLMVSLPDEKPDPNGYALEIKAEKRGNL